MSPTFAQAASSIAPQPTFTEVLVHLSTELEAVAREFEGAVATHQNSRAIRHGVRRAFDSVGGYAFGGVITAEDNDLIRDYLSADYPSATSPNWQIAARGIEIAHLVRGRIATYLREADVHRAPAEQVAQRWSIGADMAGDASTFTINVHGDATSNPGAVEYVWDEARNTVDVVKLDESDAAPEPRPSPAQAWRD